MTFVRIIHYWLLRAFGYPHNQIIWERWRLDEFERQNMGDQDAVDRVFLEAEEAPWEDKKIIPKLQAARCWE